MKELTEQEVKDKLDGLVIAVHSLMIEFMLNNGFAVDNITITDCHDCAGGQMTTEIQADHPPMMLTYEHLEEIRKKRRELHAPDTLRIFTVSTLLNELVKRTSK